MQCEKMTLADFEEAVAGRSGVAILTNDVIEPQGMSSDPVVVTEQVPNSLAPHIA